MTYADKAEDFFGQGYNCAQAVFGAFADEFGMDVSTAMRVASSMGGGLGHTGEVCGAALGMVLAVGLAKGDDVVDMAAKGIQSERVKRLMEDFKGRFGATGCDELREVGNRAVCVPYVRYAAELTAKVLQED
ncbi:C-GCAxxG-C-C family protein [Eubacteriales bacterium OttesenSCG-928-A19]|nr:C-GCAxxG-C-C family protein [Eubacteriales bacterium OttesenSCG-928-A19]